MGLLSASVDLEWIRGGFGVDWSGFLWVSFDFGLHFGGADVGGI
jgi:hypothetical protein